MQKSGDLSEEKYTRNEILNIRRTPVRASNDIDNRLMRQAMRCTGATTRKAAVESGLRLLAETHAERSIWQLRGKVHWEGERKTYRLARRRAVARLREGLDLKWTPPRSRDELHRR